MGQKVHPFGFRLGFNKTWRSRWYSDRDYAKLLHEDLNLRSTLKKRYEDDLAREAAVKFAIEALFDAADEDVGTGGPDLMRGIFPTVVAISAEGTTVISEDEIKTLFEELIADRMERPHERPVDVRAPGGGS